MLYRSNRQRPDTQAGKCPVPGLPPVLLRVIIAILFAGQAIAGEEPGQARERVEPMGFLYGVGFAISQEIYRDYDRRQMILPILGYRGEKLNVFGPFVSYEFYQQGQIEFSVRARPRFQGFDDSDSDIFDGMKKRKDTLDVGLGMTFKENDWKLEVAALHDALDRSDGYEISTTIGKLFRTGPVFLEPSIGLSYQDSNLVDYYYGVRDSEATPFRNSYEGDHAINTTVGISLKTMSLLDGLSSLSVENTWYGSGITDSPLVGSDSSLSLRLTYSRFF
jgi:MipA family protein